MMLLLPNCDVRSYISSLRNASQTKFNMMVESKRIVASVLPSGEAPSVSKGGAFVTQIWNMGSTTR